MNLYESKKPTGYYSLMNTDGKAISKKATDFDNLDMALIAFMSAPVLLALSRFIMRRMKEYRKRVLDLNSRMMSFEVETFFNFDMIKSFGIFGYYSKKLREWQQRYKEYNLDYNRFQIKSNILLTLLTIRPSFCSMRRQARLTVIPRNVCCIISWRAILTD